MQILRVDDNYCLKFIDLYSCYFSMIRSKVHPDSETWGFVLARLGLLQRLNYTFFVNLKKNLFIKQNHNRGLGIEPGSRQV